MPKDTFFNLDEEKKEKIIQAAKEEFTQNQLLKSRVSNIIRSAGIPRGSFYQYFEDLEDLYFYVIDESFDQIFKHGIETSYTTNDIFEFSEITFDFDYDGFTNDKRHQFMMNVLKSISDNQSYVELFNKKRLSYIKQIIHSMDLSNIRLKSESDLLEMYHLIQDIKRSVIGKSAYEKKTKEEAKKRFKMFLDMIKYGVLEDTE